MLQHLYYNSKKDVRFKPHFYENVQRIESHAKLNLEFSGLIKYDHHFSPLITHSFLVLIVASNLPFLLSYYSAIGKRCQ